MKIEASPFFTSMLLIVGGLLVLGVGDNPTNTPERGFATRDDHPVAATLVAEHTAILLGGETRIGVLFELENGWHIYAEEPGDAGLPTQIAWSAPEGGVSFSALHWPTPQRFLDPGDIETFGYEGSVLLASTLEHTGPWRETPTELSVQAQTKWLTCKEICIPGGAELSLTLPVILPSSPETPIPSTHADLFEQAT